MNSLKRYQKLLKPFALVASALVLSVTAHANPLSYDSSRNVVYAGFSGTVALLDVADPTNPTLINDSIKTQGVVKDIFYHQASKRLYVAADEGDLEIWDVQNINAPQLISNTKVYYYNTETPVISVAVKGNIAFVSTAWGYMHRLDVSDPANPVDLGFDGRGGNPSRELSLADDGSLLLAGPDTIHYQLDANGSVLSSTGGFHNFSEEVFRNSGTTYSSRSTILKISGANFVETGKSINDIYAVNNLVFIASSDGLVIWDVSNKNTPYIVGTDSSQLAGSVVVNGNYAYVAFGSGVRVVDVSTVNNPSVLGVFDEDSGSLSNVNPIANTSLSQAVDSGTTVSLNGTNSYDTDGTIVAYSWVQDSGTPVVINNANTATPSFTALYDANITRVFQRLYFTLTVTDNDGGKGSGTVQINVSEGSSGVINGGSDSANVAPIADAGSDITARSKKKVKLNGSNSYDTDGSIVKYAWKQTAGKRVRLKKANKRKAKFKAPKVRGAAIQLEFELTVTDNKGKTASSTVNVTVTR
jgi:hypothetical protein